jgi:glyoxylase-like metal-dependent hydrolase (beta-lactamase superfamily II)/8-oxo-dGTP pyrophosphatase MutT (NUDIX family)
MEAKQVSIRKSHTRHTAAHQMCNFPHCLTITAIQPTQAYRMTPTLLTPRPAATLILARDGADGPEIFLMQRTLKANFVAGAYVFPGGAVDPGDADPFWADHAGGFDDRHASRLLGLEQGGLAYWIAAIRETFEESGLLLATGADGAAPDADELVALRARAAAGELDFTTLCRERRLRPALTGLRYFSHWITPPGLSRRFDTRFFLAAAPAGQIALPDQVETIDHAWVRPEEALARQKRGEIELVFATIQTLRALSGFDSVAAMLDHAQALEAVPALMPRISTGSGGRRMVLPNDRAYAEVGKLDPFGEGHAWSEIAPGRTVQLSERVRRLTAPNPGYMTGPGTNSYLVGDGDTLAIIDPGPDDAQHVEALLREAGATLRYILATHTHMDHSPAARRLKELTGAEVLGMPAPPHARQDQDFAPDRVLRHGERLVVGNATLRVVHTPGHASNHLCYLLEEEKMLFTGDHIMQGSTVVINPPDGNMQAYFDALRALFEEDLDWLAPGHGFLIDHPHRAVRRLLAHRQTREDKVLRALREASGVTLAALLPLVYDDVPAERHAMAARSLFAHLEKLAAEGKVVMDGEVWQAV